MDETVLLERARKGDHEAFAALVRSHRDAIYRAAYHVVKNEEEALDVVQETLIQAFRKLSSFEGRSSFRTWARRIAVNRALNKLRRKRSRPARNFAEGESVADANSLAPSDRLERNELQKRVHEAIDSLPEAQATAIRLHDIEGMTYQDISEATGVNAGTVMSRIHYGRLKLKDKLADLLGGGS